MYRSGHCKPTNRGAKRPEHSLTLPSMSLTELATVLAPAEIYNIEVLLQPLLYYFKHIRIMSPLLLLLYWLYDHALELVRM